MSDQTYASPGDPYWLSSRGVQSVSFDKQAAPPLAYLDKGILYELNDGVLYFNGVPLSGGGGGDVSGPASSDDNALARFDGATGKIIQNSRIILEDGSGDSVVLNGKPSAATLPMMLCTDTTQKTTLGLRTPIDSSLGLGSTAIGNGAMQLSTAASNCTAVGADALYQIGTGNNNVAIGAAAGLQLTGTDSHNILIDSPGTTGDNDTIRIGNPLFHTDCYIQGIRGSAPPLVSPEMVIVDAAGKLSSQTIPAGTLSYGTPDVGALLVYKSPTEVATTSMSYNNSGGAIITDTLISKDIVRMAANHSAYVGAYAGGNFSGSSNAVLGGSAMGSHSSGGSNTAIGGFALFAKTTGSSNTAVGSSALQNITTGSSNIVIGSSSASAYTGAESNNIVIGVSGTIGDSQQILIGDTSKTRTHIGVDFRSHNTNLRAGYQSANTLNEATAAQNVILGNLAGGALTNQSNNTLVGYRAAVGTTSNNNTVVGANSYNGSGLSSANAVFGSSCAPFATGSNNTIIGYSNATALTTGSTNIVLGSSVGGTLTTGSNNILIGANAAVAAEANTTRIGIAGTQTRTFISGISGVTTGGAAVACLVDASGQLGTISSSREVKENIRDIEDTSFLHQIELKNFEYIGGSVDPITGLKQKQVGVIAEDIELIKPEIVLMQGNGVKTVDYQYMFVCALKEIQKLKSAHDALSTRVLALETPVELPPQ